MEHVLWHVRFSVLLQLIHCRMRAADVWTVPLPEPVADEAERLLLRLQPRHHGHPVQV